MWLAQQRTQRSKATVRGWVPPRPPVRGAVAAAQARCRRAHPPPDVVCGRHRSAGASEDCSAYSGLPLAAASCAV
jgi:hypothetical protein